MTKKNNKKSVSVPEPDRSASLPAFPLQKVPLQLPAPVNELTLEDAAAAIEQFYCKIQQTNRNLTEMRTTHWAHLGDMLVPHKDQVEALNRNWIEYVVKKFPWLGETRRLQCMDLARWGERIKPYYHLGIDRIYDLFKKLKYHHMHDPDFDHIRNRYAYIFDPALTSLPEKEEVKAKADVIRNFFKFKNKIGRNDFDKDLALDTLEAGCTFGKKDYEYLNQPNVAASDIDHYLKKMMVTASSPASKKSSSRSRISIQVILSMLMQTVQEYNSEKVTPEYLNVEFVDDIIDELTTLRNRMAGVSDDQEVS